MNSGFLISNTDFLKMSERTQSEILNAVTGRNSQQSTSGYGGDAADLSTLQATQLVKGLSSKTRNVLRTIVELKDVESGFWMAELAKVLECEADSLAGVWSGLTRRTRTITGDENAFLIDWVWHEEEKDYVGTLDTVTIKNLRSTLNVR